MTRLVTCSTFIILMISFSFSEGNDRKVNCGTVLFTDSDMTKECWSSESIALLTSRMMLEDVLPARETLIIKDSGFITDIVDYFRLVLEVVRQITYGKSKHVMLLALTDTLGGYLNHLVIPTAKHAYYGGYIDFDNMEKLYQLFDELKCYLRTNGHGWAKPVKEFSRKMEAECLPMQSPAPKTDPCKGLVLYNRPSRRGSTMQSCPTGIPMPFFDSKTRPSAIAVPFKTYSLRSVESKAASYVLVKFYMAATKCLAHRNADKASVVAFGSEYLTWIHAQVLPRLCDDKFYSAFGGVLRVQETLIRMGMTVSGGKEMGHYNIVPETQIKEYSKEVAEDEAAKRKKSNLILMALLATIFIWFLLGSMFICYRIRAAKCKTVDDCFCDKPNKKESSSSRTSSKQPSKPSNQSFRSKQQSSSSATSRSKKTTTTSGRNSPVRSVNSALSISSKASAGARSRRSRKSSQESVVSQKSQSSRKSGASQKSSRTPDASNPPSGSTSGASARSVTVSTSSRPSGKDPSVKQSALRKRSQESSDRKSPGRCSLLSRGSKRTSKTSSSKNRSRGDPKPKRMYPASCACHTSMTGKYRMTSSSEEQLRREKDPPLVYGYELETSSSDRSGTPKDLNDGPQRDKKQ